MNTKLPLSGDYFSKYPDGLPGHARDQASLAAAMEILPRAGKLQRRVYACLLSAGAAGATGQEIADMLGARNIYSILPRLTELAELMLVEKTERTKVTPPRCPHCKLPIRKASPSTVWVAKERT